MIKNFLKNQLSTAPEIGRLKVSRQKPGPSPLYQLSDFWSLNLYGFSGKIEINAELSQINPGMACLMPPGTRRRFHFPSSVLHRVCHFKLKGKDSPTHIPPTLFDLGSNYSDFLDEFDNAAEYAVTQLPRAQAEIWALMWKLTDKLPEFPYDEKEQTHDIIEKVTQRIEKNITESFKVSDLLTGLEISHNHALRLFQKHFGKSIMQYVRSRRMEIARHFLVHTDLPVKVIAIESGIPDLHLFNKTIRKEFGMAPRKLRTQFKKG